MEDIEEFLPRAQELLLIEAEHFPEARRDPHLARRHLHLPKAVIGTSCDAPQPCIRELGKLPLRHVPRNRHDDPTAVDMYGLTVQFNEGFAAGLEAGDGLTAGGLRTRGHRRL